MFKKTAIIGLIAIIHFALCAGIVPGTMSLAAGSEQGNQTPSAFFRLLVGVTTVLHYPIISLALYSRHWFPGKWIYIPIGINSLLWGIALYAGGAVFLKLRRRGQKIQA